MSPQICNLNINKTFIVCNIKKIVTDFKQKTINFFFSKKIHDAKDSVILGMPTNESQFEFK